MVKMEKKKMVKISVVLKEEDKDKFKKACSKNHSDMAKALSMYIEKVNRTGELSK